MSLVCVSVQMGARCTCWGWARWTPRAWCERWGRRLCCAMWVFLTTPNNGRFSFRDPLWHSIHLSDHSDGLSGHQCLVWNTSDKSLVAIPGAFWRLMERQSSWQLLWLLTGICTDSSALVQGFRVQSLLLYRRENATLRILSSLYSKDKNHAFLKKCLPVVLLSLKASFKLLLWICSASKQKAGRIPGLH